MNMRSLHGMSYKSFELEHPVKWSMAEVLSEFSHHLRFNNIDGYVESMVTKSHPDDEDLFLTTLIYAEY